jgi:hypothetical protein
MSGPIDPKYNYDKGENYQFYTTYDFNIFMDQLAAQWPDTNFDCKEFITQDCEMSGDCFEVNTKTGEEKSKVGLYAGIFEAEEGQCDSDMMKKDDGKMMIDEDGNMMLMESAKRLAAGAFAALSVSMTLF